MLKYGLLANVAACSGIYAFNPAWASSVQLYCFTCNRMLQPADINEVFLQSHPVVRVETVRQASCALCGGYCDLPDKCVKCPRYLCSNCAVEVCCTTGQPTCSGCGTDFFEVLMQKQLIQQYLPWLQRLFSISTSDYMKQRHNELMPVEPVQDTFIPCRKCNRSVQKDSGMCKSKCLCLTCECQYLLAEDPPNENCQVCRAPLRVQFIKHKCAKCTQPVSYPNIFYSCIVCNMCICKICARSTEQQELLRCSKSAQGHRISEAKLKRRKIGR